jgi:hypothetical protein
VDSNVILDVITADPHRASWSATQLAQALDAGPVLIKAIFYAEIAFASDAMAPAPALKPGVSPHPGMQQERRGLP